MRNAQEAEFAEFYAAMWPRLFRSVYAIAGDRQATEDALQTAFGRAWAQWARVCAADDRLAYVRRMAVNAALERHRRDRARPEVPVAQVDDRADDPRGGRDLSLWAAVLALPPRQRAVVVLRYYEALSEREIAEVLRCRPGTVKSQASAAIAHLRRSGLSPEEVSG